jgi:hypothetical protein
VKAYTDFDAEIIEVKRYAIGPSSGERMAFCSLMSDWDSEPWNHWVYLDETVIE